ncbi:MULTISPECIES: hypothetical protein [unclassified Bradyrhizobium]|uniref:hypothetical protein n=1 Tax=unclassified Bradyrhizobium TaxID=2631580 RepID=UPI001CD6CDFA|nr:MULTISPECIES: hypothetical protein [unclassified Bradyrhizobium]MCA1386063.1 hypothetical protein [Bradyrhizobium sp. BRP05]MCA1393861.1 hypothetical protein [Bradyrhizobium sp. IC3123]MCA1423505.1 hypothetical protein [Bradyrhizobium sp. BRP23]MCA1430601.1 hypothetical protein [Bradyrhizobium sp. NBAIM16]MCA1480112.1 hypothetical protein [Bradyrhizobium sp. NBAIM08]
MSSQEISTQSTAAADRDLTFVVIERHRELSAHYDAALSVSAKLDGPEFDAADEISSQRTHALAEHANVLIRSTPTSIAGVIALTRYVGSLREWELPDDDAWYRVFLGGLADAIDGIAMAQRLGRDGD